MWRYKQSLSPTESIHRTATSRLSNLRSVEKSKEDVRIRPQDSSALLKIELRPLYADYSCFLCACCFDALLRASLFSRAHCMMASCIGAPPSARAHQHLRLLGRRQILLVLTLSHCEAQSSSPACALSRLLTCDSRALAYLKGVRKGNSVYENGLSYGQNVIPSKGSSKAVPMHNRSTKSVRIDS